MTANVLLAATRDGISFGKQPNDGAKLSRMEIHCADTETVDVLVGWLMRNDISTRLEGELEGTGWTYDATLRSTLRVRDEGKTSETFYRVNEVAS